MRRITLNEVSNQRLCDSSHLSYAQCMNVWLSDVLITDAQSND